MAVISGLQKATVFDPSTGDTVQFDRLHDDTEASVRNVAETDDTDTNGQQYFAGFRSECTILAADLSQIQQLEDWMTGNTRLQVVAVGFQRNLQWYERDRPVSREVFGSGRGQIDKAQVSLRRISDANSHEIHGKVNLLQYAGWRGSDGDADGVPDNYTNSGFTSTAFTDADGDGTAEEFAGFAPTDGSEAHIRKDVVLPISGISLTLSALFNALHADGTTAIEIQTLDFAGTVLQTETQTVASTGRASVTLASTHADTYTVRCKVAKVSGASAQTTKVEVADPALRVDGGTSYIQY